MKSQSQSAGGNKRKEQRIRKKRDEKKEEGKRKRRDQVAKWQREEGDGLWNCEAFEKERVVQENFSKPNSNLQITRETPVSGFFKPSGSFGCPFNKTTSILLPTYSLYAVSHY